MRIAFLGNFGVSYSSESHHAATLESLGHKVIRIQEPQENWDLIVGKALASDLFIWVHTHGWNTPDMRLVLQHLREARIPSITYHLDLWFGLQRQRDMLREPYWELDHFFTVDKAMADWLNNATPVRGHYVKAGVFEPECYMAEPKEPFDVAFVGSKGYHPEWKYRPQLIDWLSETYGERFHHYGGGGRDTVRGAALNQVYADARVVVGDSLCLNFTYPDYWSDRVYETLGRGGFLIHPYIKGMTDEFTGGKHLQFYDYGDFDQLKLKIDHALRRPAMRERIRGLGHEYVKANCTYTQRWQQILKELG